MHAYDEPVSNVNSPEDLYDNAVTGDVPHHLLAFGKYVVMLPWEDGNVPGKISFRIDTRILLLSALITLVLIYFMATLLEASAQEASAQEPPITNDNPIKLCIKLMADLDSRSDCIVFAKREWNLARVIRQCNADPSNRQLAFSGHYLEREKLVGDYVDLKSEAKLHLLLGTKAQSSYSRDDITDIECSDYPISFQHLYPATNSIVIQLLVSDGGHTVGDMKKKIIAECENAEIILPSIDMDRIQISTKLKVLRDDDRKISDYSQPRFAHSRSKTDISIVKGQPFQVMFRL